MVPVLIEGLHADSYTASGYDVENGINNLPNVSQVSNRVCFLKNGVC